MTIVLNGQEKTLTGPTTITNLLMELGLSERRVAVEVNREIVPRSRHGEHVLQDRDRVEVVLAIGGGAGLRRSSANDKQLFIAGGVTWR